MYKPLHANWVSRLHSSMLYCKGKKIVNMIIFEIFLSQLYSHPKEMEEERTELGQSVEKDVQLYRPKKNRRRKDRT